jgi:hypothetical protein
MDEQSYIDGYKSAFRRILREAAYEIGGNEAKQAYAVAELEQARVSLRRLCLDLGIDGYDRELSMPDVIEKLLHRRIEELLDGRLKES